MAERVSSWEELRAALAGAYPLRDDGERGFEISVPLKDSWHAHAVRCRRLDRAGSPWLELAAEIGPVRSMSPLFLLGDNFKSTVGMVGVSGGLLSMRLTLPLDDLLAADVADAVHNLAHHAAEWRRQLELHFK